MNISNQKVMQKHYDNTVKNRATALGVVAGSALVASQAHALEVSAALTGSDAESNIETGAVWVLGIVVLIYGARKVIGFFSR